jgi:hypothetical protein
VGQNLRDVFWDGGVWTVVGNNGTIATSTNLLSWDRRLTRARENLHEAGVFRGRSITIGNRGTILESALWVGPRLRTTANEGRVALRASFAGAGVLQSSDDLRTWSTVTNWSASAFEYAVTAQGRHRFYRAVENALE